MFSRSNRSSRSSSANSISRMLFEEEQPVPFDVNAIDLTGSGFENSSNENGVSRPPELSEDNDDNPSIQIRFTQNHPMGRIFINLLKDSFQLAKKTNVKEMESELHDMCSSFYSAMRLDASNVNRKIKKSTKDLEESIIEKELNGHLLNEDSTPPTHFSKIPTLITPHLRNEAMKIFPTRNPRFSGQFGRDATDIDEFLSTIKTAQEYCNLSEKEFKQFLLLSTTGRAHTLIAEWIKLNESIPTIYHSLVMHFDKRMSPEAAKELLFAYKAPKQLSLREIETNIMLWVSRAASTLPAGPSRVAYYNMEIIQTLIRCLPPISSARVQSTYNSLSAKLNRAAEATELSRALNLDRHAIDKDIRQNGTDKHFRNVIVAKKPRKAQAYSVSTSVSSPNITKNSYYGNRKGNQAARQSQVEAENLAMMYTYAQNQALLSAQNQAMQNSMPQVYNTSVPFIAKKNFGMGSKSPNRPFGNRSKMQRNQGGHVKQFAHKNTRPAPKNYCSLCGKTDHLAGHGCPHMVNDAGVKVAIMPAHNTCALCPARVQPRLNHPSSVCPYRRGGPFYGSR